MKPILLEIVADLITTFGQCRPCGFIFDEAGLNKKVYQKEIDEYPPDLIQESEELSNWIRELKKLYKHRLFIQLIDVKSLMGIYKSLRYRFRKYPTFIVEGKETYTGWDKNKLESLLDRYIHATLLSKHRHVQPTIL